MKNVLIAGALSIVVNTLHAGEAEQLQHAFSKSYTYESNKQYDSAVYVMKKVYSENSYECNLRLGWLEQLRGKYVESIAFYRKASALMPAATEPLWGEISPLVATENWTEVEKCYLKILSLDTKNALANYRLGLIYYYRKDYTRAKSYFDVSLNLYPFDYDSMLMSAWTNYFLSKTNEAKTLFNKVLLYKPSDKSALEGLSLIK